MNGKLTLMRHQRYALACMSSMDHLAVFYEAGTGKTAIALTWLAEGLRTGRIENALIVCPASLVANWNASIEGMARFEGISDRDVELLKKNVTVTSFRKIWVCARTEHTRRDGTGYVTKKYSLSDKADRMWDAVFIDESHALGGHSSAQTKACLTLARLARHRYIMTGTPVSGSSKAGGKDWQKLYGQIRFLDPDRWGSWTEFCKDVVTSYDRWYNPESYNRARCEEIIQQYGIFAKLEDCTDMPGYTDTAIPCELAEKEVYKDVKNLCVAQYNLDPKTAATQFIKLLQVCSGHLKDDDGRIMGLKTSKDEALTDILSGTTDPVVIFCNFIASIDRCAEISEKCGRRTAVFDGGRKLYKGAEAWKAFQRGDLDTIVIQYQAGGAGLDLFASHTMVLFEPCLSSLNMTQARARIYRKGQAEKCRYIRLETPGTIERRIWESVLNGVDVTAKMMADLSING